MNETRVRDIPALSSDGGNIKAVVLALREAVQTFRGFRGDNLDRALTMRDLSSGLVGGSISSTIVSGGSSGTGGSSGLPDFADTTPAPTPTGFAVSAGLSFIGITHDVPTYTQGRGHDRTLVFGAQWPNAAPEPTFSSAVPLGSFQGTFGAVPANPGTRWCLWIKWQTMNGYASVDPAGGTHGQQATTAYDPAVLLSTLTGQITRSQLYSDIGAPIDLITAPSTTSGSVNARIKTETDDRLAAIAQEVIDRDAAIVGGVNSAKAYTDSYAYSKLNGDALAGSFSILSTAFSDPATGLAATRATLFSDFATVSGLAGSLATLTTDIKAYANDAAASAGKGAMNADPGCTRIDAWVLIDGAVLGTTTSSTAVGRGMIRFPGGTLNSMAFSAEAIPINPTKRYRLTARLLTGVGNNRHMYVTVRMFRADNSEVDGTITGWGGSYGGYVFGDVPSSSAWTEYGADFGAGTSFAVPADVAYVRVGVWGQYTAGSSSVDQYAQDVRLVDVTDSWIAKSEAQNYTNSYAYAKADGIALAGDVAELTADYGPLSASVEDLTEAMADPTTGNVALALRASTLEASVNAPSATAGANYNPTYAALQTEQSVRAALDGAVQSLWTLRAEVSSGGRSVIGGFGLAGTATASQGPRIDFGVRADRFWIGAPNDGSAPSISDVLPFVVQTADETVNGVFIPKGVYMDAAYIKNVTALVARLGSAWIDNAMIANLSAAKLTAGDGTIGGNLKSTVFSSGSGSSPGTGWLLTPDGTMYASGAVIYGTIYASAGVFAGSLSAATGSFSGNLSGSNITGTVGTFSGSLNVNSGGSNRMEITSNAIKVYNGGVKRVQLGDLSA